nr:MAG TPA: hypothetical protein [Caudoviricetes sp.]
MYSIRFVVVQYNSLLNKNLRNQIYINLENP